MIPDLGRIVEQALVALLFRRLDDLDQRGVGQALLRQHPIGFVDISLVMLAVMIIERFGRHVRRQGILGERKVGKGKGHVLLHGTGD